jgi:hypothetical protein
VEGSDDWVVVAVLRPHANAAGFTTTELRAALTPGAFEVQARASQGFLVRERVRASSATDARATFLDDLGATLVSGAVDVVGLSARTAT